MKFAVFLVAFASSACAMGQAPDTSHTYSNPLGFSYSVPSDWEVKDTTAVQAAVKQKEADEAATQADKQGAACLQVPLVATHGGSVIEEVALPWDCYGQTLTEKDLPEFGGGVAGGLKNDFEVSDPVISTYALGGHHVWIERAHGVLKADPTKKYTLEVACALLQKAAVCWAALAADDSTLAIFEHGAATLEGDGPQALVPASAWASKP